MKAILDTHTLLWWGTSDPRLTVRAHDFISDMANELYFSVAGAWEIAIKAGLGKLELPEPPEDFIHSRLARNQISSLPITLYHALRVYTLLQYHNNPFDRVLIAQSQVEQLPILTADAKIALYDIPILW